MHLRGPWTAAVVAAYLAEIRIPIRLAVNGPRGVPVVLSLWYLSEGGALWCATRAASRVAMLLGKDPACAFEIAADAPPYRGVRGQGRATILPERGAVLLERLMQRYGLATGSGLAARLRAQADEVAIRIDPDRITSWDYAARMRDAIIPSPNTPTGGSPR